MDKHEQEHEHGQGHEHGHGRARVRRQLLPVCVATTPEGRLQYIEDHRHAVDIPADGFMLIGARADAGLRLDALSDPIHKPGEEHALWVGPILHDLGSANRTYVLRPNTDAWEPFPSHLASCKHGTVAHGTRIAFGVDPVATLGAEVRPTNIYMYVEHAPGAPACTLCHSNVEAHVELPCCGHVVCVGCYHGIICTGLRRAQRNWGTCPYCRAPFRPAPKPARARASARARS